MLHFDSIYLHMVPFNIIRQGTRTPFRLFVEKTRIGTMKEVISKKCMLKRRKNFMKRFIMMCSVASQSTVLCGKTPSEQKKVRCFQLALYEYEQARGKELNWECTKT